ncbi:MAG: carbohydrate kinase family protein, partial [Terrimicrobiaceae bacterium]
ASTARNGILAGGNWILDRTKIIDVYPAQDALASILAETTCNGGGPYNVLVDLARLQAPFPLAAVGLVGDDAAGEYIRRDCQAHGIDTRQLHVTQEAPTSYDDVMTVKSTGRRTFFLRRGANAILDAEHFDFTQSNARIFHLGYLLLLDRLDLPHPVYGTVAAAVLERAQEAGLKTSVDLQSEDSDRFTKIVRPALRFCDYCVLNEFEAERTTGIQIVREGKIDIGAASTAAHALLDAGVREWVVIHFPAGSIAVGSGGQELVQASINLPQARIVGTVGAGDAFAAGVLFGLHERKPMDVALNYGVCAAAASLTDATSSDGVRPLSECLQFAEEFGYRPI